MGAQRDDQAAVGRELGGPGRGDVPRADGDDDRVEGSGGGQGVLGVGGDHLDVVVARRRQGPGGPVGDLAVDVDGDDLAVVADDLAEEGGVVAAAADLQDSQAGLDAGLPDHQGLEPGGR